MEDINHYIILGCLFLIDIIITFSLKGIDPKLDMFLMSDIGSCIMMTGIAVALIFMLAVIQWLREIFLTIIYPTFAERSFQVKIPCRQVRDLGHNLEHLCQNC